MNKQQFLERLKSHLNILSENEVKDILDEYADTIDQKVQEGMSEEDAVKDFGNIEDLYREILDAYKINTNRKNTSNSDTAEKIGNVLNEVVDYLVKFFTTLFKDLTIESVSRTLVLVVIAIILLFVLQIPFIFIRELIESFLRMILPYGIGFAISKVITVLLSLLFSVVAILMIISFVRVGINGEEINAENLFKRPLAEGVKFEDRKQTYSNFKKEENKENTTFESYGTKKKESNEHAAFESFDTKKEGNSSAIKQTGSTFGKGIILCFVWIFRVLGICCLMPFWAILIGLGIAIGVIVYLVVIGIPFIGILLISMGMFAILSSMVNGLSYLIFNKSHRFIPVSVWLIVGAVAMGIGFPLAIHELTSLDPIYVGSESSSAYFGNKKEIIGVIPYDEEYTYNFGEANVEFVIDEELKDSISIEGVGSDYLHAQYFENNVDEMRVIIHQSLDNYKEFRDYMQIVLESIKDKKVVVQDSDEIEIVVRVPKDKVDVFKYYDSDNNVHYLKEQSLGN